MQGHFRGTVRADPPLGPFAPYFESPQVWVEDERARTDPSLRFEIAFERVSSRDVPILFRRDGFLIFRFDEGTTYAGGAVPEYEIQPGQK